MEAERSSFRAQQRWQFEAIVLCNSYLGYVLGKKVKAENNKMLITNFYDVSTRAVNRTSELLVYHFCPVGIKQNATLLLPAAFPQHTLNLTVEISMFLQLC